MTEPDSRPADGRVRVQAAVDQVSASMRDHLPRLVNVTIERLAAGKDTDHTRAGMLLYYATQNREAVAALAAAALVRLAEQEMARRRRRRWLPGRHWFGWLHGPGPFRPLRTPGRVTWTSATPRKAAAMARAALTIARKRAACTSVTARWCLRCGTCSCGDDNLNNPWCRLHRTDSNHAEGNTGPRRD